MQMPARELPLVAHPSGRATSGESNMPPESKQQVAARQQARRRRVLESTRPWMLLTPALIIFGVLLLWPLVQVILLSLQDYGLRQMVTGTQDFIGLGNYREIFSDPMLWKTALPNTVLFAIASVVSTVAFGTLVAVLMSHLSPLWRNIVGSAIMVAWAMPAVTGTYVWVWIFDADHGIVNRVLQAVGILDEPFNWFTNPATFYLVVLLNVVHHGFPFVAITVLAGLLGVPQEILEAAELDGASAPRRFFSIIVPILRQVFTVVIILSTIWDFKVFTQVYLSPGGAGENRRVLNLGVWSYVESFGQNRYGLGSAIAVLLTAVLMVISVIYVRMMLKEETD